MFLFIRLENLLLARLLLAHLLAFGRLGAIASIQDENQHNDLAHLEPLLDVEHYNQSLELEHIQIVGNVDDIHSS